MKYTAGLYIGNYTTVEEGGTKFDFKLNFQIQHILYTCMREFSVSFDSAMKNGCRGAPWSRRPLDLCPVGPFCNPSMCLLMRKTSINELSLVTLSGLSALSCVKTHTHTHTVLSLNPNPTSTTSLLKAAPSLTPHRSPLIILFDAGPISHCSWTLWMGVLINTFPFPSLLLTLNPTPFLLCPPPSQIMVLSMSI